MTRKHIPVVMATIKVALEYIPNDLQAAAAIQNQIKEAARKLPGFISVESRTGRIPAPDPVAPVQQQETSLDVPPFLKRG